MPSLVKNFTEYHEAIKKSKIDMPQKVREKRDNIIEKFKNDFPDIYEEQYGKKLSKIEFIHQGSYKIDTVINENTFDIDLGVIITPHEGFDILGDTKPFKIAGEKAISATNRSTEIKKPCITVSYTKNGDEDYHLDFPMYIKLDNKYYLAWGKPTQSLEKRKFKEADPIALNNYFANHLSINQNNDAETNLQRKQTRRLVRYLKQWKFLNYGEPLNNLRNTKEVPPSITLTILVCQNYTPQYNSENNLCDLKALYEVVNKSWNSLFTNLLDDCIYECNLPTVPYTDTLYKICNNKDSIKKFRSKLSNFRNKLKEALEEESGKKAAEILANPKVLGDFFPIFEEKAKANESDSFA